jgi:flagellar motor switch/type III secretory pathway protein FliN
MDTSDSNDWPVEDSTNEPPSTEPEEAEPSSSADQKEPAADESSESGEEKAPPTSSMEEDGPVEVKAEPGPWTLPIRAAPILSLQGENVVEFPLSQHVNGLSSTSVVVDEELMRIVEARYDPDGVRRLNVRMALVKEHISGYSHTHLDVFAKLQPAWWTSIGLGLLFATSWFQGLLLL